MKKIYIYTAYKCVRRTNDCLILFVTHASGRSCTDASGRMSCPASVYAYPAVFSRAFLLDTGHHQTGLADDARLGSQVAQCPGVQPLRLTSPIPRLTG